MPNPCPLDPTPDEALDNLQQGGGRMSVVLLGALGIMERVLPGVIERAKTRFIHTRNLPEIQNWMMAGEKVPDKFPCVIVSGSTKVETMGVQAFGGEIMLSIGVIYGPSASQTDLVCAQDICAFIRAIMVRYVLSYTDPNGQKCWEQCVPISDDVMPLEWKEGRGWQCRFAVSQYPNENRWKEREA